MTTNGPRNELIARRKPVVGILVLGLILAACGTADTEGAATSGAPEETSTTTTAGADRGWSSQRGELRRGRSRAWAVPDAGFVHDE